MVFTMETTTSFIITLISSFIITVMMLISPMAHWRNGLRGLYFICFLRYFISFVDREHSSNVIYPFYF